MKKNINKQVILFVIVGLVIIIALLIPYTTDNKNNSDSVSLTVRTLTCDDDNTESSHETTLNKISCQQYNDIINGEDTKLVLYARPSCGYCNQYIPILEEIVSEYGIEINYFDTDILSESEITEFYSSSNLMSGNEFGTPTLVTIKSGKITAYSVGYKEKDSTIEWLTEKGIITE